jgi:hypothetical protein
VVPRRESRYRVLHHSALDVDGALSCVGCRVCVCVCVLSSRIVDGAAALRVASRANLCLWSSCAGTMASLSPQPQAVDRSGHETGVCSAAAGVRLSVLRLMLGCGQKYGFLFLGEGEAWASGYRVVG